MGKVSVVYDTREQAQAFCDGVQWVNDSAITPMGVEEFGMSWAAVFEDEDDPFERRIIAKTV